MKFIKSIPFHIKTAFVSMHRHLAMSLSAIVSVMVTLILFSVFLLLVGNVDNISQNIESDLRIHAVIKQDFVEEQQLKEMETELRAVLGVKSIEHSSKDQELQKYISEKGEIYNMYEQDNPLHDAFYITVANINDIEAINAKIKNLDFIQETNFGGESVNKLVDMLNMVKNVGLIFIVLLTLLSTFLINNTIKITIYARASEIGIMRNVGASNAFIKAPFLIEGMLVGIFGAIMPAVITVLGYQSLYSAVGGKIITYTLPLEPVYPFVWMICAFIFIFGIVVGAVGSYFSTRKYLKWKR